MPEPVVIPVQQSDLSFVPKRTQPDRLVILLGWLGASLSDVASACNRSVSRSQIHRILRGEVQATPFEKKALSTAISRLLVERMDSSILFDA